jgi:propane monooxygenase coupling protein
MRAAEGASAKTAHNRVGISFMVSSDTEAIVEATRQKYPDAQIGFRECFYKVEREGSLEWSMDDVGERLGRPYDTDLFLVNMSSYYGRIVVSDGWVRISSEMVPNRFRD